MAFPVLSTYRLQLRGAASGFGFTFADAENLLDYLDDLGVSHLYLSPIFTPVTRAGAGSSAPSPTTSACPSRCRTRGGGMCCGTADHRHTHRSSISTGSSA